MLFSINVKMALNSLKTAKWRSFLTMLGVIIGIVSVVTTVSLGEGVKQQVTREITQRGSDLITVLPGKQVERNDAGEVTTYNPLLAAGSVFSEADLQVIQKVPGTSAVVPFARVSGIAQTDERKFNAQIIATNTKIPEVLNQPVEFGAFFKEDDPSGDFAVIGKRVAEQLFGENVPMGKSFRIRDRNIIVRGVFEEFEASTPLLNSTDYDSAIFLPYETGKQIMGGNTQIYQILVKPENPDQANAVLAAVSAALLEAHAGAEDFTVLRQSETLALTSNVLNVLTGFIAGIAAISLLVGGIGIMNIMFVSVSERTGEIGLRKAVGATNSQILGQFLIEAVVISFVGGVIGVFLSLLANFMIRIFTNAQPVISLPIILIATGVAFVVGTFFGVAPALKAARKDPIDALRYIV